MDEVIICRWCHKPCGPRYAPQGFHPGCKTRYETRHTTRDHNNYAGRMMQRDAARLARIRVYRRRAALGVPLFEITAKIRQILRERKQRQQIHA